MNKLSIIAAMVLLASCSDQSTENAPLTKNTIYPKSFTVVDVTWSGNQPTATIVASDATRFSESDKYVIANAEHNALVGKEMGFKYDQLVVPTPYAAFPIDHKTGKLK